MATPASEVSLSDAGPHIVYVTATEDSDEGAVTVTVGEPVDYDDTAWDQYGAVLTPGTEDREDLIDEDLNEPESGDYDPYAGESSSEENRSDEEPEAPQEVE